MFQIKLNNYGIIEDIVLDEGDLKPGYLPAVSRNYFIGDPIDFYDKKGKRYTDQYLYRVGKKPLPIGYTFDLELDDIREFTEVEKVEKGLVDLPCNCEIVDNQIVPIPMERLYRDKKISKDEYIKYKRSVRNEFLFITDKYFVSDFPIIKELKDKLEVYRQYLRDLPENINWPDIEIDLFSDIPEIYEEQEMILKNN